MKIKTGYKEHVYQFDGIGDMLANIAPETIVDIYKNQEAKWVGASIGNKAEFTKMVNTPWEHGLKVINQFIEQLAKIKMPSAKSRVRRTRYNEDDGDEICLDRLRAAQPYWRQSHREVTNGPNEITIMFDCGGHWQLQHDFFLWRGAAAIALTEVLEGLGYRVELWMVYRCSESKTKFLNGTCLKKTSDVLDKSSLSMAVSAWFHRQGNLNIGETEARELKMYMSARGLQEIPTAEDLDNFSKDENRIYVAGVDSFDSAVSIMTAELQNLSERNQ